MNAAEELQHLVTQVGNLSPQEIHDLSALVCWKRDAKDFQEENDVRRIETALRAYLTRSWLGKPTTIKKIREEFGLF